MSKGNKTASISIRIDADLKEQLFEHLEAESKTFSKWLRNEIEKYLENKELEKDCF